MKTISKQTINQVKKSLQEIYVENIFRFVENKYKGQKIYIPEEKTFTLSKKWMKRKEVIDILNLTSHNLFEFFETEFNNNEKEINDFLLSVTHEYVKENREKEPANNSIATYASNGNKDQNENKIPSQYYINKEKMNYNANIFEKHQDQ